MRVLNKKIFDAVTVGTGVSSAAIDASFMLNISLIATIVGTSPVGVISLQASNDIPPAGTLGPFVPTNWNDFATVAVSANGTYIIPKTDTSYQYIRAHYLHTSGTSTVINAFIKTNGM